MSKYSRLDEQQKLKLSMELQKLDTPTKCKVYHEAEEAIRQGTWSYTSSEYVYDQLFLNENSPVFVGDK